MQDVKANPSMARAWFNNLLMVGLIVIILVSFGLYGFKSYQALFPAAQPAHGITLSQSALEERYGLRVSLIAVTAAGGMVDVRLKILDGEKAKLLLQNKQNFPSVAVSNSSIQLAASEDSKSQEIKFDNDGNLFLLFTNAGNAVKRGTPVTVRFGDITLESIAAK